MDANDALLYERWTRNRDANAFAELVFRHSAMVYATCLRMLRNPADAEDVAQECFFELLTARVRVRSSLAPWLYTVAFRRSLDRRKADRRRTQREHAYERPQVPQPDASREELLRLIDESIAQLPETERELIVERFLNGKSNAEMARASGIAESTLRYRIERSVERLRATLGERGVSVSVAVLSAALGSTAADAAPASLNAQAAKLAIGSHAGAHKPVVDSRSLWGYVGAAAIVIGAVVTAWFRYGGDGAASIESTVAIAERAVVSDSFAQTVPAQAGDAAQSERETLETSTGVAELGDSADQVSGAEAAEVDEADDEPPVEASVSGYVYDDAGLPIVGARVAAATWISGYDYRGKRAWSAETDETGFYEVAGIQAHELYRSIPFIDVSVSADGYMTNGRRVTPNESRVVDGANFKLVEGVSLRGRLLSVEGMPVDDAVIVARWHQSSRYNGNLNYVHAATDRLGQFSIGVQPPGQGVKVVIDQKGNRTLVKADPGGLSFIAESASHGQTLFVNVPVGTGEIIDLRMERPANLTGTLTWSDGTPARDLHLGLHCRFANDGSEPDFASNILTHSSPISTGFFASATTDAAGRFQFGEFAPGPDFVMTISSEDGAKDTGRLRKLATEWLGPMGAGEYTRWDFALARPSEKRRIVGRVIGAQSNAPLRDAHVHYELVDARKSSFVSVVGDTGAFEIVLDDAGGVEVWPSYGARQSDALRERYGRLVRWDDGVVEQVDFRIPDPFSLSIHAVDVNGAPVAGLGIQLVGGNTSYGPLETDENGHYTFAGFEPGFPSYFRISGQGFIATESTPIAGEAGVAYPSETVVMYGDGGIDGVAVDADGSPIANARLAVSFRAEGFVKRVGGETRDTINRTVQTDANGAFAAVDGIPAIPGQVRVFLRNGGAERHGSDPILVSAESGLIVNVGVVALKPLL